MAREKDERIRSATFFATQVDFRYAGDLKVFVDEDQVRGIEESMKKSGYLEGSRMATAFNMLRASELIWPYVVNNYLKGKDPMPFDLLYWNSDATRMAAANHSFYLRNCYHGEQAVGRPHGTARQTGFAQGRARTRSTIWRHARTTSPRPSRPSSAASSSAAR